MKFIKEGIIPEPRPIKKPSAFDEPMDPDPDRERTERHKLIDENIRHLEGELEASRKAHDILADDHLEPSENSGDNKYDQKKHLFPHKGKGGSIDVYV